MALPVPQFVHMERIWAEASAFPCARSNRDTMGKTYGTKFRQLTKVAKEALGTL